MRDISMTRKVFMLPTVSEAKNDDSNSINQIVLRLDKELREFGWELTEDKDDADIVAIHAGQTTRDVRCDVAHCHGLYPTGIHDNTAWHYRANENVIRTLKQADAITVPSEWVADIVRRNMNVEPDIVRWAIDRNEWMLDEHEGYTLWNKTRASSVCDPTPLYELAGRLSDAPFVTTFLPNDASPRDNIHITGRLPYSQMKPIVQKSAVYLATTKETFGIGILEAMASGSPILGYRWGAVPDIVEHGVTGYLVEPNDIDGLVDGWRWIMRHRRTLAWNARQSAIDSFYSWHRVARQFAGLYDEVFENKKKRERATRVAVIIPHHDYDEYVDNAVLSAIKQRVSDNTTYEVIVINDNCTHDQTGRMTKLSNIAKQEGVYFSYVTVPFGSVARTRNHGIADLTDAEFIMCLDADDQLARPDAVQTLLTVLVENPDAGVAYGRLAVFKDYLEDGATLSGFPNMYDPRKQVAGENQVPSCCLFRRTAWERAGGYRQWLEPAEDAGLWTLMAHYGYPAIKATDDVLLYYRMHEDSLSHSVRVNEKRHPTYWELHGAWQSGRHPFASAVKPRTHLSHPVYNYDKPDVTVIIPVGDGHRTHAIQAIDSVNGQTHWNWECIVINDSGKPLALPQTWVKVIATKGATGAGYARNVGLRYAQGKYVVFLDADDALDPEFLERTLPLARAYNRYIYTDWFDHNRNAHESKPYSQQRVLTESSFHAVTALIPTAWAREVGGFDEKLPAWEDTDFFLKLAVNGYCGKRLAMPLFTYDYTSGQRRKAVEENRLLEQSMKTAIRTRYSDYREGDKDMCKCNEVTKTTMVDIASDEEMVEVIMVQGATGGTPITGDVTRTRYGMRGLGDVFLMYASDARARPDKYQVVQTSDAIDPTPEPPAPTKVQETML